MENLNLSIYNKYYISCKKFYNYNVYVKENCDNFDFETVNHNPSCKCIKDEVLPNNLMTKRFYDVLEEVNRCIFNPDDFIDIKLEGDNIYHELEDNKQIPRQCICTHNIYNACYILHKPTNNIFLVGTDCATKINETIANNLKHGYCRYCKLGLSIDGRKNKFKKHRYCNFNCYKNDCIEKNIDDYTKFECLYCDNHCNNLDEEYKSYSLDDFNEGYFCDYVCYTTYKQINPIIYCKNDKCNNFTIKDFGEYTPFCNEICKSIWNESTKYKCSVCFKESLNELKKYEIGIDMIEFCSYSCCIKYKENNPYIVKYSPKSIAVMGYTNDIGNDLLKIGGKYNQKLKGGSGYIFFSDNLWKVKKLFNIYLKIKKF